MTPSNENSWRGSMSQVSIADRHTGRRKTLLWEQIAELLRREIELREPGTQLDTELELAARFGVSRFTVRQALADLERRGLVRIQHGRGLFVAEQAIPFVLDGRMRFSDNLKRLGLSSTRKFLGSWHEPADAIAALALDIEEGDEVVVVRAMAFVANRPIGLTRDLYPAERFSGIEDLLSDNPSPTAALTQLGVEDYRRKNTRISSRMPDQEEADLLGITRTRPLLETTKIDVDVSGQPIAWGVSSFPADRVHIVVE
ncbi:phosphonate metabolism transcriptional regulator PhnF [Chelativorans sp. AA-79]|uniref:phosphonate metabolism transcriptional regulator PhnF n=1 Tax=Chelativorans sp. AA-79 TaxID=3028735 RepID=UPI0023F9FBC2|nr:phosphonate metabolism transcriptional regulator PhnF [Chelativorans sp. AA-79]WEX08658.1 phosphonate metabolism transcriptional regulator PhnF [Chelativorans sp. AA-79]